MERLALGMAGSVRCGVGKWSCSQCPCCTHTWGLTAFLAALQDCCGNCSEILVIVRGVDLACWWRYDSKQNQFAAMEWGFANGAEGAKETTAHLSLWMCAEIHFFCACSLTALLVRTKSFLYYTEYVSVQL